MWSPKYNMMFLYMYIVVYLVSGAISYAADMSFSIYFIPGSREVFNASMKSFGSIKLAHAFNSMHAVSWVYVILYALMLVFAKPNWTDRCKSKKSYVLTMCIVILFFIPGIYFFLFMGYGFDHLFSGVVKSFFLGLSMFVILIPSIRFLLGAIKLKVEFGGRADV